MCHGFVKHARFQYCFPSFTRTRATAALTLGSPPPEHETLHRHSRALPPIPGRDFPQRAPRDQVRSGSEQGTRAGWGCWLSTVSQVIWAEAHTQDGGALAVAPPAQTSPLEELPTADQQCWVPWRAGPSPGTPSTAGRPGGSPQPLSPHRGLLGSRQVPPGSRQPRPRPSCRLGSSCGVLSSQH